MQRILFLEQYGDIGGGQRILLDLAQSASEHGFEALVLCPEGPLQRELRNVGIPVQTLRVPPMRDGTKSAIDLLRSFLASRQESAHYRAEAHRADCIVVNGPRTLPLALRWKKPTILFLHNSYRGLQRHIMRWALRRNHVSAIAPVAAVADAIGLPGKTRIIPYWVRPSLLSAPERRGKLRAALDLQDDLPLVLVPGRLSKTKGQLQAIAAMRMLASSVHMVFTGRPLFERDGVLVERALESACMANAHIHHLPWEASMVDAYDDADLVLMPSVWDEPFGLTAIESMARSRPLIVSRRGALSEIAGNGEYAEVIEPEPQAIAHAIQDFLQYKSQWKERAVRAKAHVLEHYNPDMRMAEVFDVLRSVCR